MVGRLVQNKHIRRVNKHRRQRHAFSLTAGKLAHLLIKIGDAELRQHHFGFIFIELSEFLRMSRKHLLKHRKLIIDLRNLRKIRNLHIGIPRHAPGIRFLHTRKDFQKRALARAVHADQADAFAIIQIQRHIVHKLLHAVIFADIFSSQ